MYRSTGGKGVMGKTLREKKLRGTRSAIKDSNTLKQPYKKKIKR